MTDFIIDITMDNAQQMLIEESFKRPVLIDFWAPWCEPCKSLLPILEKVATEHAGNFLLAKVNADDLQMIASQFGVRSLPAVILMKDGQPLDGFNGLKPESEVQEFLAQHLPKPWDEQLLTAKGLMAEDDNDAALPLLRDAYQTSNQQADIAVVYGESLVKLKRFDEAEAVLETVRYADQDAQFEQVKAQLELAREAQKAPEIQALEDQYKRHSDDGEVAFQLALQYSQHEYRKEALALLFTLIQQDINFKEGEAKQIYLDILTVLGKGDPIAAEYQRKLYTLLH